MKMEQPSRSIGKLVVATRVVETHPGRWRARSIILFLTVSCALTMIGFGIPTPVFAKRLGELGSGVEALGLMTTASAFAQFLLAPLTGMWADRFGRRPFILLALAGLIFTNISFLLAKSVSLFIAIRFLQGAVSVGLLPAVMGVIADLVAEEYRQQWVGVVMSGYAVGFVFGPTIGGLLFERWGYMVPFGISALLDLLALLLVLMMVPESRPFPGLHRAVRVHRAAALPPWGECAASLPQPLSLFASLLLLDFVTVFGMEFLGPQMVFYLYKTLAFTPTQYGFIMGSYGFALFFGQAGLGRLSDSLNTSGSYKKPMIVLGFLLTSTLPLILLLLPQFSLLILAASLTGLGNALITLTLQSTYLDITAVQFRSLIMGIRESAVSLGAMVGPLLVAFSSSWLTPQSAFTMALLTAFAAMILTLVLLKLHCSKEGRNAGRGTPERLAIVVSTLNSMVEEVRTMRQPT